MWWLILEVSVDGTSQFLLTPDKLLTWRVLTRYCRQCGIQNKLLKDNTEAMIAWKENHKGDCKLNHNGSAPAMEGAGAKNLLH